MLKPCYLLILFLAVFNIAAQSQNQVSDPDPLRFEKELDVFAQWDKKNSSPEEAILFVGSSSIKGWETHLAFPDLPIINRGFGGSHISDVNFFYQKVIKKYNPRLIVFYAGDNDIAAGKPVKRVFDDYQKLTDRILSDNPNTRFLFISIKPSGSRLDKWNDMNEFNQQVDEYNQLNERLFYIDLATPLLNSEGRPDHNYYLDDQLHLNNQGYDIWNQSIGTELHNLFR
ncbi:MAG: GDSL-type esterase/lipase family protein [Balneolales bacterium]